MLRRFRGTNGIATVIISLFLSECSRDYYQFFFLAYLVSDIPSRFRVIRPSPDGPLSTSLYVIPASLSTIASNFVQTEGIFDPIAAQNVGRDPETVGNVPVTLSLSSTPSPGKPFSLPASSFSSSAVSPSSPDPFSTGGPDANGDSVSSSDRVPAIVGGLCSSHCL